MITSNRDIDNYILNRLDDRDLFNFCLTSKYSWNILKNDMFWMNRILLKFPEVDISTLNKYRDKRKWLEYYKDLRKINSYNANEYLTIGSKDGRLDYIIISLKNGADIHAGNDYALSWASEFGYLEVVKYLIENGADVHAGNYRSFRCASRNGHLDIVKYLIENGVDIHVSGDLALREPGSSGYLEVVKYLKEKGTNINVGHAIELAKYYGRLEVVKYLQSFY